MKTVIVEYMGAGMEVAIDDRLGVILEEVASAHRGRFAYVENHVSGITDPKCIRPAVGDKWFISLPRYSRYLERTVTSVEAVDFFTFTNDPARNNYDEIKKKLNGENMETVFNKAKEDILKSAKSTQTGDRSDGYRQGHDRCYAYSTIGDIGVTLHMRTETGPDGRKQPVILPRGYRMVDSVMLPYFLLTRRVKDEGQWKDTNSRVITLMKNAIKDVAGIPEWNTLSLGLGNFSYISLDSKVIFGKVADMTTALLDSRLASFIRFLCDLSDSPFALLRAEAQATVRA